MGGTVNCAHRFIREMRSGKDELPLKMYRFIAIWEAERRLSYKKVLKGWRGATGETRVMSCQRSGCVWGAMDRAK